MLWGLLIQYRNYHILLFRPKAIENLSTAEAERDIRARMAADSITRMAEDLLAAGTLKFAQIHLYEQLVTSFLTCLTSPASQHYSVHSQSTQSSSADAEKTRSGVSSPKTSHDNAC